MAISSDKRLRIYTRDNFVCLICKSNKELTLDHIIPISFEGSDDDKNLRTLCKVCNLKKGNYVPTLKQKLLKFMFTAKDANSMRNELVGNIVAKDIALKNEIKKEFQSSCDIFSNQVRGKLEGFSAKVEFLAKDKVEWLDLKVKIVGIINNYEYLKDRDDKLQEIIYLLSDRIEGLEKFHMIDYDESSKSYQ